MANINLSDMLTRNLLLTALRSLPASGADRLTPRSSLTLAQIANLSLADGPSTPTLEENTYYDKYKEKLAKAKQSKPNEYKAAVKQVYAPKSAKIQSDSSDVKGSSMLANMKSTSNSGQHDKASTSKSSRNLDSIVKLELLHDKTASEITQIWNQHYSGKEDVVFATIPAEKYDRLKVKGKEHPLFIYPLPRESGYEFMLGQCSENDWYYTPLIAYQTHGEYAPHSLAIHYYTELADSKGIVLMVGEVTTNDLKLELATLLVHETQLMYGSDENFKLIKLMHEKPNDFQHMDVVNICKKAGLF